MAVLVGRAKPVVISGEAIPTAGPVGGAAGRRGAGGDVDPGDSKAHNSEVTKCEAFWRGRLAEKVDQSVAPDDFFVLAASPVFCLR